MIEAPGNLRFLILGDDTQVGQALCQYLAMRQIPFSGFSNTAVRHDAAPAIAQIQSGDTRYVVNSLFEEPAASDRVDTSDWLALNQRLVEACHDADKPLLLLSSARVFSGRLNRPYAESDTPEPVHPIGQAFWQLEQQTAELCKKLVILRTSWLFSGYIDNFLTRLVGAAVTQETLKLSSTLRGNPTDANVVARVLVAMCEQIDCGAEPELWGTYHYADSDGCTMFTFAKTVITVVKSMVDVRVENIEETAVSAAEEGGAIVENYQLSSKKILSTFGIKQRPWRRGVHDVLKQKFASGTEPVRS